MCSVELCNNQPSQSAPLSTVVMTPPWTPQYDASCSPHGEQSPTDPNKNWPLDLSTARKEAAALTSQNADHSAASPNKKAEFAVAAAASQKAEPASCSANQMAEHTAATANQKEDSTSLRASQRPLKAGPQLPDPAKSGKLPRTGHKFTELKIPVVKRTLTESKAKAPTTPAINWAQTSKEVVDKMIETVYTSETFNVKTVKKEGPVCVIHSRNRTWTPSSECAVAARSSSSATAPVQKQSPSATAAASSGKVDLEELLTNVPFTFGQIQETLIRKAMEDSYMKGDTTGASKPVTEMAAGAGKEHHQQMQT